ncbi:hypothetical protein NLU13_6478 [Sarocladium strictum]|uniref:Uncharacterized protein n=1 Tax=Sarocladium strictum TaxID=5046 RepID=A0AA39L758_SARSR|nr:hypothetical protein NLU13_6478 [Sarocladium strictum]
MGRWGHRLFEGDSDIDIACELNEILPSKHINLSDMVHQTDMMAPQEARDYYQTPDYKFELASTITTIRRRLDSGLGDQIMAKCREKEAESGAMEIWDPRYKTVLAAALIMRAGARIKADHVQHLKDIVPQITCNYGFTLPFCDQGFRYPGKLQFLAALDNYVPGTPRNFEVPSCFACSKIEADVGAPLKKCSHCKKVWYCNKVGLRK